MRWRYGAAADRHIMRPRPACNSRDDGRYRILRHTCGGGSLRRCYRGFHQS